MIISNNISEHLHTNWHCDWWIYAVIFVRWFLYYCRLAVKLSKNSFPNESFLLLLSLLIGCFGKFFVWFIFFVFQQQQWKERDAYKLRRHFFLLILDLFLHKMSIGQRAINEIPWPLIGEGNIGNSRWIVHSRRILNLNSMVFPDRKTSQLRWEYKE